MEQYDKNVTAFLEFFVAENFSASVISLHRLCHKALRKHLIETKTLYFSEALLTPFKCFSHNVYITYYANRIIYIAK